ncbi:MAG: glycosyltransferase [Bacteroidetes bacterium]|nr:glycosyltransferase [Bacteroidota bacterium]MBS1541132.1 glycosyltransferase [Bacteroidota bacterium]
MQEIKKNRILIASVLKPVDEPRMYSRLGQSLVENGYEVFVAGFPPSSKIDVPSMRLIPHARFSRISWGRVIAPWKILMKAFQVKPSVLIIATHELLPTAIIYRIFTGNKIIYDVQEDYKKNILYTDAFPRLVRPLLAMAVRCIEILTAPFVSQFLLAEKCYEGHLGFGKKKSVVIENKCKLPDDYRRSTLPGNIQLLFTGTLAKSTGVLEAIRLAKILAAADERIRLKIVGHCSLPHELKKIKEEITGHRFITLVGGSEFVPHEIIFIEIAQAHFGIISYPPSTHTSEKMPTKLYEYLAGQLPVILQTNTIWEAFCLPYQACLPIDWMNIDADAILLKMKELTFYPSEVQTAHWVNEEAKLIGCVHTLMEPT